MEMTYIIYETDCAFGQVCEELIAVMPGQHFINPGTFNIFVYWFHLNMLISSETQHSTTPLTECEDRT